MLCGLAGTLPEMVLFRLVQGLFGASLVPLSQAVLLDIYPKEKHGQAMAMWGMGVMVGPILGPTLGGWLTETYNWRWVFYINVPIGILTFAGLSAYLSETKITKGSFDWFGFAMLSLAIGSFQMMLDRGEQLDWFSSTEIVVEAVVAALAFYLFLVQTFTVKQPFIDPAIFKDRNFTIGLCFIFVVGIILLASLALITPYLQNLMGYPVITAGMVLGAARHRHHGRHDDRRPHHQPGRPAPPAGRRPAADRRGAVGDELLHPRRLAMDTGPHRHPAGHGAGLHVRAALDHQPSPPCRAGCAPRARRSTA